MDEVQDKQNLFNAETEIKTVAGDKNLELQIVNRYGKSIPVTDLAEKALEPIKHCQICQRYADGLKTVSGQMACPKCYSQAQSKQLAKAQQSFWFDQPTMFKM